MVLRWKKSKHAPQLPKAEAANSRQASALSNTARSLTAHEAFEQAERAAFQAAGTDSRQAASRVRAAVASQATGTNTGRTDDNPLRHGVAPRRNAPVRSVAYQDVPAFPSLPGQIPGSDSPDAAGSTGPDLGGLDLNGQDPLGSGEAAPIPGGTTPEASPFGAQAEPIAPQEEFSPQRMPQFDPTDPMSDDLSGTAPADPAPDFDDYNASGGPEPFRPRVAELANCETLRDRLNQRPLSDIDLNPSPKFGNASRLDYSDAERAREEFADTTKRREWHDYLGRKVATGRFVDMKHNKIFIDDAGQIQTIHYLDLSDQDTEYVNLAWKVPGRCGTGFVPFERRNFTPTHFQWTASGLCHKPAYLEQPQLERYGHTAGPVLQPLLSSAKFFTGITLLPYKMGIHPPNECQYSLGYIRPGNCAPYMIQPFPWSLRGAAVQAGVVTGG
ncbi:MAG TPA: hypothetical protein DDW52_26850, partial [Planctomycetaceae bacterium]|nr:hypothetical protein [Planctomycetaceae bacterium]